MHLLVCWYMWQYFIYVTKRFVLFRPIAWESLFFQHNHDTTTCTTGEQKKGGLYKRKCVASCLLIHFINMSVSWRPPACINNTDIRVQRCAILTYIMPESAKWANTDVHANEQVAGGLGQGSTATRALSPAVALHEVMLTEMINTNLFRINVCVCDRVRAII